MSSGTYSLSALLVAGALAPALAVGEFNPGSAASVTASQPPAIPNPTQGLTNFEGLLIFAPVILYGGFSLYRSKVDQRAKVRLSNVTLQVLPICKKLSVAQNPSLCDAVIRLSLHCSSCSGSVQHCINHFLQETPVLIDWTASADR